LHLGSGFRPWRRGGLVAYAEDLMSEQVRRGHQVAYLFSGRQYPYGRRTRLRRWKRDGVRMLEVIDSPLYDHGRQPELEIDERRVERIVERAVASFRPDAIHVQELAGLPLSVLEVARRSGAPVVCTLQDYFPLCPTFKLLDSRGEVCLRNEIGADCVATTAADPRDPVMLIDATLRHDLDKNPLTHRLSHERLVRRLVRRARVRSMREQSGPPEVRAAAFQRRRDFALERLNGVDRLIAMSRRVAEIYELLGVDPGRLRTMQLTLGHIERLTARRRVEPQATITFATLGGGESHAKGAGLLLDAARLLGDEASAGRFRVLLCGHVDPAVAAAADGVPGIEVRGPYRPSELDALLDEVDVGIVPSIWEEAYAYAGMEFLAKGIPVIANAIGGMVDYTREGETGWLNNSCDAAGLAQIMRAILERPAQVAELNEKLIAGRGVIVKPMAVHAAEMDGVYRELIGAPR
jgi:glycosyltransferase involved in cell wall biosynthesis